MSPDAPVAQGVWSLSEASRLAVQEIEQRYAAGGAGGRRTGLSDLDELLGPLRPGTLTVVASRPGVGQTTFALQTALAAASRSVPTLVASNDLDRHELIVRLLMLESGVDGTAIREGRLNEAAWRRLGRAMTRLDLPVGLAVGVDTMDGLDAAAAEFRQHNGTPGLVVVDQATRLVGNASDVDEVGRVLRRLGTMAVEHDGAMVATARSTLLGSAMEDVADAAAVIICLEARVDGRTVDASVVRNRFGSTGTAVLRLRAGSPAFACAAEVRE